VFRILALSLSVAIVALFAPAARAQASPASDLSIQMVDAPDPVAPGKVLTYRISVTARGNRAASSVAVRSAVPAGTSAVSFTGPATGWTYAAPAEGGVGAVTATAASIPPGRTAIFQLSVRVAAETPEGATISNTATVEGSTTDPTPADNAAATSTLVRPTPPAVADVSVSVDYLQEPVASFGHLVAMVSVQNAGPMTATDLDIRVATPAGTSFVLAASSEGTLTTPAEGGSGEVVAHVDALPAHRVVLTTVVLKVTAAPGARVETLAAVTASSTDPELRDNVARAGAHVIDAGPVADVTVAFANAPEHVATGSELSYDVVVTNAGPAVADDITALVPVPRATRLASVAVDRGLTRTPPRGRGGAVGWKIGTLAPGESATLTLAVRVRARAGAPLVATAIAASRATDTDLADNVALAATRVQTLGDVVVQWQPPDLAGGTLSPAGVVADAEAAGAAGFAAKTADARADGDPPICYNVYVSGSPQVAPVDENLLTSVPANQTTTTAPVAPGGSFFTVTAVYADGESAAPNSDGAGDVAGASLTSMKITSAKITAKGSGFTDTAEVLLDGIPFVEAAKVKGSNTKAVQKGSLVIGQTVEQYMATGTTFLVIVRNNDGSVSTWEYEK
jgi:uncharacterized repeat protein (TIGR01451 family)